MTRIDGSLSTSSLLTMLDGAKSAKFVRHTRKNVRLSPHNRLIENLQKTVYYVYNCFCKKVNDKDITGFSFIDIKRMFW
jgi:hypothetical protein